MKTLILLVLAIVGLTFSPVFAGEVLVNKETSEVEVEKSNSWLHLDAFVTEAFRNPGKEIPVWSSSKWNKPNFFHRIFTRTATNVVIYEEGGIHFRVKEVREEGFIFFLWYKLWLIVAMMAMVGSNVAYLRNNVGLTIISAFVSVFLAIAALLDSAVISVSLSLEITILFAWIAAQAFGSAVGLGVNERWPKFFSWIFYVSASAALII